MRAAIMHLATQNDIVTRAQLRRVAPDHVLDDAIAAGALVRLLPGIYAHPDRAPERRCLQLAATGYTAGALSHTDGLAVHGFVTEPIGPVHVTVSNRRGPTRLNRLVVHRRTGFVAELPLVVMRADLPVVRAEQALVESWPLLPSIDRRAPIIAALRERKTAPHRLLAALAANPRTAGAREIRSLVRLVQAGCHSELELWGHSRVLMDPRLPQSRAQVRVSLPSGVIYFDRYFDAEMVALELDGAAWHGSSAQRERDVRRDAQAAALGIVVVRITHQRLHREPDVVIDDLLRILEARRRQLAAS